MRYFKKISIDEVFGYDETDPTQIELIAAALDDEDFEEVTGSWPPVAAVEIRTTFTALEFLEKFTESEQLAVVEATISSVSVKLWYDKMLAASFVDLNDPRTESGLAALVTAGLITEARKDEILEF